MPGGPAWHRRQQLKRRQARDTLRTCANLLQDHHGSAAPSAVLGFLGCDGGRGEFQEGAMAKEHKGGNQRQRAADHRAARSSDAWCCKICLGSDGLPFRNFGDRKACHKCGLAKGSCFLRKSDVASKRPPSSNMAERQAQQRQATLEDSNRELRQQLAAKERELARLAAGPKESEGPVGKAGVEAGVLQSATAEAEASKTLWKHIQQLKGLDPALRETLCASSGGYEATLRGLESRLDAECTKQREQKPIAEQKASADAHLKRMQKAKDEAASKLQQLQVEQAALAAKVASQTTALAVADAKLHKARLEVAAITEKATAELRSAGSIDSSITAAAVTGWFNKLPPEVAQHAEAQQAMHTVMQLMQKLDAAKTKTETGAAHPLPAAQASNTEQAEAATFDELEEMELDEDQASALATRISLPKGEDEEEEQYQDRIKASTARLRGGSLPLAGRGMLVKKTVQKK